MTNLNTRIKRTWTAGEKNGAAKLALICEAFAPLESGDWTSLALCISRSNAHEKKRVAAIIEAASGITFRACSKNPTGLKLASKGKSETNRIGLLQQYVDAGTSLGSGALSTDGDLPALLEGKEAKKRTVEEIILAAVRKARKDCGDAATNARIMQALNTALAAD